MKNKITIETDKGLRRIESGAVRLEFEPWRKRFYIKRLRLLIYYARIINKRNIA